MFAVGGDNKFPLASGLDAVTLHQLSDTLFADPDTSGHQFFPHFWPTVFLFDFGLEGLDVYQRGLVADAFVHPWLAGLGGVFAAPVFKLATGANLQRLAGQGHGPYLFVL